MSNRFLGGVLVVAFLALFGVIGAQLLMTDESSPEIGPTEVVETEAMAVVEPSVKPEPEPMPVPRPIPQVPPGVQESPSRSDVLQTLRALGPAVVACGRMDAVARVRLDFEGPGGTVTGAEILSPELVGTQEGACILEVVRGARLQPFGQPTFSVTYPYSLRAAPDEEELHDPMQEAQEEADEPSGPSQSELGLTASQISEVVARNRSGLQRCYDNAVRLGQDLPSAHVTVRVTLAPGGSVQEVSTDATTSLASLGACIERRVRRWRFPRAPGSTRIAFPVVFTSSP